MAPQKATPGAATEQFMCGVRPRARTHQSVQAGCLHQLAVCDQEYGGEVAPAAVQQAGQAQRRRPRGEVGDLLQPWGGAVQAVQVVPRQHGYGRCSSPGQQLGM